MSNTNKEQVVIPTKFEAKEAYKPVLLKKYREEIAPALQAKFSYTSTMEIPRLEKIVINMGVGDATQNAKLIEAAVEDKLPQLGYADVMIVDPPRKGLDENTKKTLLTMKTACFAGGFLDFIDNI